MTNEGPEAPAMARNPKGMTAVDHAPILALLLSTNAVQM